MAFESLSEKLQNAFRNLRGKGRLSEDDVKLALKEIRIALLEADVNYRVVKDFTRAVQERAVGTDILNGLNPAQQVVKLVDEELTRMMGSETREIAYRPGQEITVIMMIGLQGAGKTTTAAKLAGKMKQKGKRPLLVACDIYRPAAIDQLRINAEKQQVAFFSMGDKNRPSDIARAAYEHARKNNNNVLILDTAGRLHIDEDMMAELEEIKSGVDVAQTILVVDAMTGQDAVNVAQTFDQKVGVDGVILTKLDGDSRGGAALSIRAVTGKPILYVGMGEKLSDLEQFYPDRMASRILGMGDVLSLIEKAEQEIDAEEAAKLTDKVKKAEFDYNDYLTSLSQMRKMGGISSILGMLPGLGMGVSKSQMSQIEGAVDEKKLARTEAIIHSMTPQERSDPKIMNIHRKHRIARGAGLDIAEVNRFVKQFEQTRKMMKKMPGLMGGKGRRRGGFPF
ncbi:signal recognition particle protein [Shuttleworthella satelles]|uniref:Signal recognition particle protein n=1 Tax=Shuttleworthella satelles DSM 14600 TaxID=626523 RepID=C4GAY8_9FIRM|nr:signal recognition particle protein [Shuttleworthia satelles]EEP28281.1 signal recognition particle protein [Shuttleworthia satelles DSM 14600]